MRNIWAKITAKIGKKYLIIIAVAIVLLIGLGFFITGKKNDSQAAMQQMKTFEVVKGNIEDTISGSGTIEAIDRKEIASECTGTISNLYVTEGQQVEKGDLIMTFDNDTYDSQVQSAQLNLQQSQTELASLLKDKTNLKIYATAAGIVGDSLPTVGSNVSKSSTFTTITDQTHMQAQASFNLSTDENISVGQTADLFVADYLTSIKGTVSSVSIINNSGGNRICNVLITIDNPGRLTSGTAVTTVNISTGGRTASAIESTTLEWPSATNVQVKTAGTLSKLYITAGQSVANGQLLAELESSDLDEQISDQRITIKQKQLSLAQQNKELENRTLYSPISGTVIAVSVTEGEEVTENQSNLVTISCIDTLQVTIPVDELDILKVAVGQSARVTSDAIEGTTFTAKVSEIAGEGTVTSGVSTFDVLLLLDDPGNLKAGMNVNAEILINSKNNVLQVPVQALIERSDKKYVKLQTNNSKETLTEVQVGLTTADMAEITSGLSEGDKIVYANLQTTAKTTESNTTQQRQGGMMGPSGGGGGGSGGGPPGGGI
ncbi:MAG TPA: efflux RND transporter periplasmic adaptor subunit [Syntrophomonas sp.]|nr:efflux RND transporter periplasmic adaptor subunit [Syntrophomonas sp.]